MQQPSWPFCREYSYVALYQKSLYFSSFDFILILVIVNKTRTMKINVRTQYKKTGKIILFIPIEYNAYLQTPSFTCFSQPLDEWKFHHMHEQYQEPLRDQAIELQEKIAKVLLALPDRRHK